MKGIAHRGCFMALNMLYSSLNMSFCTEVNEKHYCGTSGVMLLSPWIIVFCYSLTSPFGLEETAILRDLNYS